MPGMDYHSTLESGVTHKLSPYQINSLAASGFGTGSSPMDIMHQAMNPYGSQGSKFKLLELRAYVIIVLVVLI